MRSGWGKMLGVVISSGNKKMEERKREHGGMGRLMMLKGFGVRRDETRVGWEKS